MDERSTRGHTLAATFPDEFRGPVHEENPARSRAGGCRTLSTLHAAAASAQNRQDGTRTRVRPGHHAARGSTRPRRRVGGHNFRNVRRRLVNSGCQDQGRQPRRLAGARCVPSPPSRFVAPGSVRLAPPAERRLARAQTFQKPPWKSSATRRHHHHPLTHPLAHSPPPQPHRHRPGPRRRAALPYQSGGSSRR